MDGFTFASIARVVQSVNRHDQGKRSILTAVLLSLVSVIIYISCSVYLPASVQDLQFKCRLDKQFCCLSKYKVLQSESHSQSKNQESAKRIPHNHIGPM